MSAFRHPEELVSLERARLAGGAVHPKSGAERRMVAQRKAARVARRRRKR